MYLWWWVSNLLRWQGTVSKEAVFFAFPSPCYLHLNPSLPPAAVSSEVNTLSSTPGARVFSLNSCPLELWCPSQRSYGKKGTVNCLSLWWPGYIDAKFCKSPLRARGRSGIHRYRVSFCTFFFHVFKLCMTFFPPFIYTWSLENRVSQKKLILPLGNLKQKNHSNPG